MVLHEIGSEDFFDLKLLNFLIEKKNDEVRKILEYYQPSKTSLKVSRLRDSSQASLLHYAAEYGNEEIAKYLIDSGSNVDARDDQGRTPLMLAVVQKREMTTDVLLNAKADINATEFLGKSALQMMLDCRPISSRAMTTLFKIKADFARNLRYAGFTLRRAIAHGSAELMKLLLDRGFYAVDDRELSSGRTALHIAVEENNLEIVRLLVEEYNAEVNSLDNSKATPIRYLFFKTMSIFARGKCLEMLKILLSRATLLTTCQYPVDEYLSDCFEINWRLYNFARADRMGKLEDILMVMTPILAHLAVRKRLGIPTNKSTMSKIGLHSSWTKYFAACEQQVDQMSKATICGNVTLFKFLTESERKITAYVRNEELVPKLEKLIEKFEDDSPYSDLLRKRLAKAVQSADLKKKAIAAMCWLIDVRNNKHYFAAEYIVDYLSNEDVKNLICVQQLQQRD